MIANQVLYDHLTAREQSLQSLIARNRRQQQSVLYWEAQLAEIANLKKEIGTLSELTTIFMQKQDSNSLFN